MKVNKKLTSFDLKIIAIVTMFIDHFAAIFLSGSNPALYLTLRGIGRLAFPIFAFLLVEGFFHTKDVKKYIMRMGIFALISEIPFDLAFSNKIFSWKNQNIYFTLFLALILLYLLTKIDEIYSSNMTMRNTFSVIAILLIGTIAQLARTDYGAGGIFFVLIFYYFRFNTVYQVIFFFCIQLFMMGPIQAIGTLSLIPIYLYNGERGKNIKYFFYTFYPLHILILYIIHVVISTRL